MDPLLAAIQAQLDSEGERWQATGFVIVVGCQRVNGANVESQAFRYLACDQPDWVTDGLMAAFEHMAHQEEL